MEFDLDLDLEDLNLKSVDMSPTHSQSKNISFDKNNSFRPTMREQSPNLTISTNNNDSMPSGHMGNIDNMFNSEADLQDKIDDVFNEIQRSDMSKLDEDGQPIFREDGKVLKGPNYFKPNI